MRKLPVTINKMADMEETTGQPTSFEEDPAAAFLAREQDELADIAEDTLGFVSEGSAVRKERVWMTGRVAQRSAYWEG